MNATVPAASCDVLEPWALEAEQVLERLGVQRPDWGLEDAQVQQRLASDGPNALAGAAVVPAWRKFLRQFHDPLVYLLLAAIAVTLAVWVLEGMAHWPVDAVVIAAVVVLNAVLGYLQEAKAANAAAALARMTQTTVVVWRQGQQVRLPSEQLVRGDVLVLAEGDAVGADARLLQAHALRVQEASLTGESEAVLKQTRPLQAGIALGERSNMVFKGTAVAGGSALAVVTATGMRTQMGAIAHMLSSAPQEDTPLQKEVQRIGRMLGAAVVLIAVLTTAALLLLGHAQSLQAVLTALMFGVSLAVAAVPEGLPAVLSVVLALGVQRMAGRRAIVKTLSSVETLGSASVICTDKTGTLTKSEMTVQHIVSASGSSEVGGAGYTPQGQIVCAGQPLSQGAVYEEHCAVLCGGALASNAVLQQDAAGQWGIQGDPTEAALLVAERKLGVHTQRQQRFERLTEIPFDSDRKLMSALVRDQESARTLLVTKGAADVLLQRCTHVRVGQADLSMDAQQLQRIHTAIEAMSNRALRTLGVAWRVLDDSDPMQASPAWECHLSFAGLVGIIDPPRPEAAQAIAQARAAGVRVIMITGDHPSTALRIAQDLGLVQADAQALTGTQIDALLAQGPDAFAQALQRVSVFARVAPAHKLHIVKSLQAQGHIVAMTGDGVNDAPALKHADIGVAMGITGTEVSKEAARMILADDNFATIVQAVREGRGIFANIRKFLYYLLSSNMGEVLTVFLGVLCASCIGLAGAQPAGGLVLPLLATQILWINLITDSAPALALGMEATEADVMRNAPRKMSERVIDAAMWRRVVLSGMVMALATLAGIDLFLPGGLLPGDQSLTVARTAGFTVLVFAQLFNCINARSHYASGLRQLHANPWLLGALALSTLLQVGVVQLPVLNSAFGTAPLSLEQWGVCLLLASSVLWQGELGKLYARLRVRR